MAESISMNFELLILCMYMKISTNYYQVTSKSAKRDGSLGIVMSYVNSQWLIFRNDGYIRSYTLILYTYTSKSVKPKCSCYGT